MKLFKRIKIIIIFLVPVLFAPPLIASNEYSPQNNPSLEIRKATGGIKIDGILNDAGWENAARLTGFVESEPGDQTEPSVETIAYITYDNSNVYISCLCFDRPDEIRATYCDRDHLVGNDVIIVMLDTYAESMWAYYLFVNPFGVQTDALWKVYNLDFGYNVIYESAGHITDSGYQVEIAIPFTSLHFPSKPEQEWKLNILRIRPRESWYEYSWVAYDRNNPCIPCQWGTVTGLKDIEPAKGIEIIPSAIGYQVGEGTGSFSQADPFRFVNNDPDGRLSLSTKYKPQSNISLEAAINPDFSQIEPDAAQIDVNVTSALFYAEHRPFFQEASELFSTWRSTFYSRMINDPALAFKISGTIANSSFGYLAAYDENSPYILPFEEASIISSGKESFSNVLRYRHTFGIDSYAGLLLTDRRFKSGGSGTVLNFDGQLRLDNNWRLQVQTIGSYIVEPEESEVNEQIEYYIDRDWIDSTFNDGKQTAVFDGESYFGQYLMLNLEERSRHFDFDLGYLAATPTYRSDMGYQKYNDWQSAVFSGDYTIYFDNDKFLERLIPQFELESKWNFNGTNKYLNAKLGLAVKMPGQLSVNTSFQRSQEIFRKVEFDNIWNFSLSASKSFSEKLFFSASFNHGQQISRLNLITGKQTAINFYAYLRPNDHLQIEPDYDYIISTNSDNDLTLYEGYIMRIRTYLFFNRQFNIRLIAQWNDIYEILNLDPMVSYRINPFTVFYLGSTYEYLNVIGTERGVEEKNTYLNRRQFFIKLQYLFNF